jgi:hypothetical protein
MMKVVAVIQLGSGMNVVGEVDYEDNEVICLKHPYEMSVAYDMQGEGQLFLSRWMPYSQDDVIKVNKSKIEASVVCNEKFTKFYERRVTNKLQEAEPGREVDNDPKFDMLDVSPTRH